MSATQHGHDPTWLQMWNGRAVILTTPSAKCRPPIAFRGRALTPREAIERTTLLDGESEDEILRFARDYGSLRLTTALLPALVCAVGTVSIEEWRPADGWIRRTPTAGTCRWGSVRVPHRSWIGAPASAIPPLGRNAFALGVPVEAYKDMSRHVRAIVDVHRWYRYFNASSEPCGRLALQELTDGLFVRSDERLLGRWLSRYVQDLTKVSRYVRPVDIGGVRKPETDYRELWHIVLTDLLAYLPGQPLALPVNEATRARRARQRRLEAPMAPNEVLNLRRELERRSTPAHREKNRLQKRAQRQRLKESGA